MDYVRRDFDLYFSLKYCTITPQSHNMILNINLATNLLCTCTEMNLQGDDDNDNDNDDFQSQNKKSCA